MAFQSRTFRTEFLCKSRQKHVKIHQMVYFSEDSQICGNNLTEKKMQTLRNSYDKGMRAVSRVTINNKRQPFIS